MYFLRLGICTFLVLPNVFINNLPFVSNVCLRLTKETIKKPLYIKQMLQILVVILYFLPNELGLEFLI